MSPPPDLPVTASNPSQMLPSCATFSDSVISTTRASSRLAASAFTSCQVAAEFVGEVVIGVPSEARVMAQVRDCRIKTHVARMTEADCRPKPLHKLPYRLPVALGACMTPS